MSGKVVLHGYFRSSASFRVRIALNLKNIAYEQTTHHLRKNDQRASAYLAVNPQGLVPTLEIDGKRFGQSLAILEYLDETRPNPPLLPKDAAGRARVRMLADVIACDIHPIDNLRVLRYLRDPLGQDEEAVQVWYNHWIAEGFAAFEALLASSADTGKFCHGDEPGYADCFLVPQVGNARTMGAGVAAWPTVERIANACAALPAFAKAHPDTIAMTLAR